MTTFTYNPELLNDEQREAIARAKASYESKMESLIADEEYRMKNYYDCVDDYSWGGLCSKANYMERDRARVELNEAIEMIVRGGFIIRTREVNILRDKATGEIVAEGTHEGRYGRFFVTGDGSCISCAKKVETYEKKGFLPYVQTRTEKLIPDGWWRKSGDRRYKHIETTVVGEALSTEITYQ